MGNASYIVAVGYSQIFANQFDLHCDSVSDQAKLGKYLKG